MRIGRSVLWLPLAVLLVASVSLLGAVALAFPAPRGPGKLAIQTRHLPAVSKHPLRERLNEPAYGFHRVSALWLVRAEDRWWAFVNRSAHPIDCGVDWYEEMARLMDPCSGSVFDMEGNLLAGPAMNDLGSYPVRELGEGWVEVDLDSPQPGAVRRAAP